MQQEIIKQSQHIACYLPIKNEFETSYLIEKLLQQNKIIYLPILQNENILSFVRYKKNDELHLNKYFIPEPVDISHQISADKLDIVFTPLTAFDLQGHRLGAGGGYYDKTFQFLQMRKKIITPKLIGLGYAAQQAQQIISDDWDIHLDAMLTEKEFISFTI